MKVVITGGAGYIGSLLTPMLLNDGHDVTIYDNFLWGIKSILHFVHNPALSIVEGDIRNREKLQKVLKEADAVIHLAAIVGYPACAMDPNRAVTTNVEGTRNVVEGLGDQAVIVASTGSTYGKVEGICTEETPIAPLTLYGSTKSEAESLVLDSGGVGLRLATVFGVSPRLRLDLLVNDFTYQALHRRQLVLYEGHFRRTFLHATDAALAFRFALNNYNRIKGQAFNIGDEAMNYTKKDIAIHVKKFVEFYLYEADVGEDLDKRDYEVSYEKIKDLGYAVSVSLDDGIQELIKVLKHIRITDEWRNA